MFLLGVLRSRTKKIPDITSDSGGVVVSGYNSNGYVHNTNEFLVRVRNVNIIYGKGEVTKWIKKFEAGEKVEQYIVGGWPYAPCDGFYVSDMNGVLIGFIVPQPK